ncbi:MAG: tetratricopeptide repeat protein [Deltaproteobacteria bacterium]|nr:tetratricopeptide repeat protein [Deltaproteobacteria bacterium]
MSLNAIKREPANKRLICLIAIIIVLSFGVATFKRNSIWLLDMTLWYHVAMGSPAKARGHNNAGLALHGVGFYELAIEEFSKAIAIKSDDAKFHSNRAISYVSTEELDEAIEGFEEALRLDPEDPRFYNNLGGLYVLEGRLYEAILRFNEALLLAPGYSEAHYNLAKALDAYGDMDGAIEHLETAVVLEAHNLKSYNYLGILYRKQGRTDEAVGIYRRALELNGDFMAVRYNLVRIYMDGGLWEEAIVEFEEILKRDPNDKVAKAELERAVRARAGARGD